MDDDMFGAEVDTYVVDDETDELAALQRRRSSRSDVAAAADRFLRQHSSEAQKARLSEQSSSSSGFAGAAAPTHELLLGRDIDREVLSFRIPPRHASPPPQPPPHGPQAANGVGNKLKAPAVFPSVPSHPLLHTSARANTADLDDVRRDKEALQRFASEAAAYLDAVYRDDSSFLVDDGGDVGDANAGSSGGGGNNNSGDDFRRKRRIELDKARLERFSREAEALIDRAYAEDPADMIVEEALSPSFFPKALGPNAHGVHAASDMTGKDMSPFGSLEFARSKSRAKSVVLEDKRLLQQFHTEAMSILDAAVPVQEHANLPASGGLVKSGRTSARIQRDKEQLEMHYREAMAFLERAECGEGIVEERELETGALDRVRLKRYAKEAMSFLENAFTKESDIFVDDSDAPLSPSVNRRRGRLGGAERERSIEQREAAIDALAARAAAAREARLAGMAPNPSLGQQIADFSGEAGPSVTDDEEDDEERQIAADREAMVRYYEQDDFGQDRVVEETLSDTTSGGTGRGLFGHRAAASTGTGGADDEWSDDDASTDHEYQDPSVTSNVEALVVERTNILDRAIAGLPSTGMIYADPSILAPGDHIAADVEVDDDITDDEHEEFADQRHQVEKPRSSPTAKHGNSFGNARGTQFERHEKIAGREDGVSADHSSRDDKPSQHLGSLEEKADPDLRPDIMFSNDRMQASTTTEIERSTASQNSAADASTPFEGDLIDPTAVAVGAVAVNKITPSLDAKSKRRTSDVAPEFPRGPDMFADLPNFPADCPIHQGNPAIGPGVTRPVPPSGEMDEDILVELLLEGKDASGVTNEWSEIPLERSFYRQLPRGATIKIRSRSSRGDIDSSTLASSVRQTSHNAANFSEMDRLSKERDVVLTALEEVVNERSRMASQIGELKSLIAHAVGSGKSGVVTPDAGEIDVGSELKAAHNEISILIQESEATVNVLEGLLADGKKRIEKLETEVSSLEREISVLREQNGKILVSREADAAQLESLKKEANELKQQLQTSRERQASSESTSFGSSGGSSHLWAMLSNARADAEEARQEKERAEQRVAQLQAIAKTASAKGSSKTLDEAKKEHDRAIADVERVKDAKIMKLAEELESLRTQHDREIKEESKLKSHALAEVAEKTSLVEDLERRVRKAELEADTARLSLRESEAACAEMRSIVGARREEPTIEDMIQVQAQLRGVQEEANLNEKKHKLLLENALAQVAAAESKALEIERELQESEVAAAKAIEAERRMRKAMEAQKNAIELESKAWSGQRQSDDKTNQSDGRDSLDRPKSKLNGSSTGANVPSNSENQSDVDLVQSSSKRGLRKTSSKVQIGKKKSSRAQSTAASAPAPEETQEGKKKGGHRLRLFG